MFSYSLARQNLFIVENVFQYALACNIGTDPKRPAALIYNLRHGEEQCRAPLESTLVDDMAAHEQCDKNDEAIDDEVQPPKTSEAHRKLDMVKWYIDRKGLDFDGIHGNLSILLLYHFKKLIYWYEYEQSSAKIQ